MTVRSRFILKWIWQLKGQLGYRLDTPRHFDGVLICPFKNGARAGASISADLELCWAWRGAKDRDWERRATIERANVPTILTLLESAGIPITWATVGHLFLEKCLRGPTAAHPEMPRPTAHRAWRGDWYAHDPCSDVKAAPGWYAPDLIRLIQRSKVRHEIASHSFSHIDFSAHTSTQELVRSEMLACIKAMEPFGVRPRSLVFCFNHMGHQHSDLLYQLGIIAVRHRDSRTRLAEPERSPSGVYRIYESMNLRLAHRYDYVEKAKVFIDEAIRRGTSYHLWFHPSDDRRVFLDALAPILQYLAAGQRANDIWVTTMGDLACYREARAQMSIRTERRPGAEILHLRCPLDRLRFGDPEITLQMVCENAPSAVIVSQEHNGSVPVSFRFDELRRVALFNVPSSASSVIVKWPSFVGDAQKATRRSGDGGY